MFALTLLVRNWRSGELKLLSVSIVLAVAVLSAISLFTTRLNSTLVQQSNALLGADSIVVSSLQITPDWRSEADKSRINHTQVTEFRSMVYFGEEMHLASIKAVDVGYPLRGQLEISSVPFSMNPAEIQATDEIPTVGEAWVDSRLLPQLKMNLGDKLAMGEIQLTVTKVLIREPENFSPFGALSPRIIMNTKDVPASNVIQQGSDARYEWLLASDDVMALEKFIGWLKPKLTKHQRIKDVNSNQERLSRTLDAGRNFLLLAAVIAVLLAGVAIAIAARQFSERHTNQVALMKSLGSSAVKIRTLYFSQLFILGTVASLIGLVFGFIIQEIVATSLENNFQLVLHNAGSYPYILSFCSGLICLTFFALPALWFLPTIPPLKILRRELIVNTPQLWFQAIPAYVAIVVLVFLFSSDIKLTLSISIALALVILVSFLLSMLALRISKKLAFNAGGFWRLAFANLQRRKGQSLVQIMVFSVAIMLLLTLTIVRTSLIDDWQNQLPADAANHFLTNIPPSELDSVKSILSEKKIPGAPFYPMIRGRLIEVNGIEPNEETVKKVNALQRELNLTWSAELAEDNKLLEGTWWESWKRADLPGVSVEEETAKSLGLKIGDQLRFSLGGLNMDARVASVRSVDWRSLKPNFFFIFEPGSMENYSPMFMTSIFLSSEQKPIINQLLRKHQSVLVLEFDRIIQQMRNIIDQVSNGIQLVLWLTLGAGSLVLFAAVMSSIDSRKQEAGLLRALGSSRYLMLGSVFAEFMILGVLAGVIAIVGAEVLLFSLQKFVLQTPIQPHYLFWILSPILSAAFISALGVLCCRRVVTTPPAVVLREAA